MKKIAKRKFLKGALVGAGGLALRPMCGYGALKIKVTSVEPFMIKGARRYNAWNMVRIRTEQGVEGVGEGFALHGWGKIEGPRCVNGYMQEMAAVLVGKNISSPEEFYSSVVIPGANKENGDYWFCAAAAIEIALWDIYGKLEGKPVWALLGKKVRDTIPVYADHGVFFKNDTKFKYDPNRIVWTKAKGYRMFKWDPFGGRGDVSEEKIKSDVAQIAEVRRMVGPDFALAIDAHGRYSTESAIIAAKAMESENISFFEAPTKLSNIDGYKAIAAATKIPLAEGEYACRLSQFESIIDSGAVSIIQPDLGVCGLLTALKASRLANEKGIKVCPHIWCGPVIARAAMHLATVVPNLDFMEFGACSPDITWENDLISPANVVADGKLDIPTGVGLGFTLNDSLVQERLIT